ncbi:MAG: ribonucleoside triphosphate reductase, partial [Chloroflexota bacterium]
LRLDNRELRKRGGGFFGANPLTGSIGVVTINLPRIAYLSKSKTEFYERLEKLMRIARKVLTTKRKVLESFTEKGLYPYSKVLLSGIKQRFGRYWYNHFSTIGINGGNEAALNLLGKDISTLEGQKFMLEVLRFMNEKMRKYQAEDNQMYNLEATPAEGTSYRLAKIDKEKYPGIIVANEDAVRKGAAPYYTNSSQLPVGLTDDLFEALDLQDELQTCYTGGTVFHAFLGERLPSREAVKSLARKIAANYHLPYFTFTPTFSICMEHGYLSGEQAKCPQCGKRCEVYSRVVGYLRPVRQWNEGKQAEFDQRKEFKVE